MPQARSGGSGGSRSSSGSRSRATGSSRSGSSRAKSSGTRAKSASTRAKSSGTRAKSASTRAKRSTSSARRTTRKPAGDARVDAAAQRLRKLNERIIDAGREAGENTLTSYEKALKAIANTIEKGPGSSDVEWISDLATAQAKFLREMATTLTARARKALK